MRYFLSLFVFLVLPLQPLLSPPPPIPWFIEHITVLPIELPDGVTATVEVSPNDTENLAIRNTSLIEFYILGHQSRSSFPDIGVELPSDLVPLMKIVDGQVSFWKNDSWSQNGLYQEEINTIWFHIWDDGLHCKEGRVLDFEPRNQYSYGGEDNRPDNVKIPESQEVLLPIVYGTDLINIPLEISYSLNPDYNPSTQLNLTSLLGICGGVILVFIGVFKVIQKVHSSRIARHSSP